MKNAPLPVTPSFIKDAPAFAGYGSPSLVIIKLVPEKYILVVLSYVPSILDISIPSAVNHLSVGKAIRFQLLKSTHK